MLLKNIKTLLLLAVLMILSSFTLFADCNMNDNLSEGLILDGGHLVFNYNNIHTNGRFGILAYPESFFKNLLTPGLDFDYVDIENNGFAEFAGWYQAFNMGIGRHGIDIYDSNFGEGNDDYLMMNLKFNTVLYTEMPSVDAQGIKVDGDPFNEWININNEGEYDHLYPGNLNYWITDIENDTEIMLTSAATSIGQGNYSIAETTLQSLINLFPGYKEASTAVYYLFHIEDLTDKDYMGLIAYLESLNPPANSPLEMAIKNIITKSYMKDKNYLAAIEHLEYIIANSEDPDEVILALIKEGYCYLELSDEGERALPEHCTIKTKTINSYQAKVRELDIAKEEAHKFAIVSAQQKM